MPWSEKHRNWCLLHKAVILEKKSSEWFVLFTKEIHRNEVDSYVLSGWVLTVKVSTGDIKELRLSEHLPLQYRYNATGGKRW